MFDTDGNGAIDSNEWERGKAVLTREFFNNNQTDMWKYKNGMEKKTLGENVADLLQTKHFAYQCVSAWHRMAWHGAWHRMPWLTCAKYCHR